LRRLFSPTVSPVSIDRSKAGLIGDVFARFMRERASGEIFNVMGHPKSLSPNGLASIAEFIRKARNATEPATFQSFANA
jgi:hypothetical protein